MIVLVAKEKLEFQGKTLEPGHRRQPKLDKNRSHKSWAEVALLIAEGKASLEVIGGHNMQADVYKHVLHLVYRAEQICKESKREERAKKPEPKEVPAPGGDTSEEHLGVKEEKGELEKVDVEKPVVEEPKQPEPKPSKKKGKNK